MNIKLLRRITQVLTILLLIAIPILNKKGITIIMGTLYSLSIDGVWITDPLSGLQIILSSLSADKVLLLSMIIPVVIALLFGRVFCGWACPQNIISETFDYLSRSLKLKRVFNISSSIIPRYAILTFLLILAPILGFPVANLISAPGIISLQFTKYVYEGMIGIEAGLIGIIIVTEVFLVRRIWCNHICPVGSFLGIMRFKRTMKVVYKEDKKHVCGKCLECVKACQLGLNPLEGNIYPFCHNCGDCIVACENIKGESKPLSFRF